MVKLLPRRRTAEQFEPAYRDVLRQLSEASVHQHFDAFLDIPWDDPLFGRRPDDDCWILPEADAVGGHPWYRTLPKERQREIGRYRYGLVAKVGLQFEQFLIAGVMFRLLWLDNENPEFRYATHEITEETHHTQMFQEAVNRIAPEIHGLSGSFKACAPLIASMGWLFPEFFFTMVLAIEEPIDHLQKAIMRSSDEIHPLVARVMQIHIAEEARHISFGHEYLEEHVPHLDPVRKALLAVLFPLTMRIACDLILKPNKRALRDMGIPEEVAREIWWDSPESRKALRDVFGDIRMLADNIGVRNTLTKPLWRALGIDGRPSRYRAQPASAAH
ncbi:MAG TPA: diiron oxygenase [Nocardioides sp.]|uniref:AurF N-oxygenase family protein n=1 Tax=Nocardioides sp. TaxID=35761 RepID=UPI002EDB26A9